MGFAQHLGVTATHLSGLRGGTPFWIAPEVAAHGRLSAAADMYAFGILIWECFAGQQPCVEVAHDGSLQRNPLFPKYEHEPSRTPPASVLELQNRSVHTYVILKQV